MTKKQEIWITGFAIFALFFGAGNLILPPYLGMNSGDQWWFVFFGFILTAVLIPILGILAHAKVQGTMYDLASKVTPWFSSLY
ncbi:branched-chain amino acid transport system II carrier protein, partial [Flavobacteriaceae bacterium]|nr:branched-chain amino acid transport system II carrier protein [Flavobacteriaceae bacterium]